MSGFEIAGIVLGAFPLVLELCRSMGRRCHDSDTFEIRLAAFIDDIREQQMLYEATVIRLLDRCFDDDDITFHQLASDTTGDVWTQQTEMLQRCLGQQLDRFMNHIKAAGDAIDHLRAVLGIDDNGKVRKQLFTQYPLLPSCEFRISTQIDGQGRSCQVVLPANMNVPVYIDWLDEHEHLSKYLRNRLVFCYFPKRVRALTALKEHISKLETIVGERGSIFYIMRRRDEAVAYMYHDSVRQFCLQSFNALQTSWNYPCRDSHQAKAFIGIPRHQFLCYPTWLNMNLVLQLGSTGYPVTLSRIQLFSASESMIINIGRGFFQASTLYSVQQQASTTANLAQRLVNKLKTRPRPSTTSEMSSTGMPHSWPQHDQAAQKSIIPDLCARLRYTTKADSCYGSITDPQGPHHFTLCAAPAMTGTVCTVASVIETPMFDQRKRVSMAISLLSALLQSYSTGWDAHTSWKKNEIKFQDENTAIRIILSAPCQPQIGSPDSPNSSSPQFSTLSAFKTKKFMSEFGVLLLEVLYGKSIETLCAHNSQYAGFTNVRVAKIAPDWTDVERKIGDYIVVRAIRLCLDANFSGIQPNLIDKEFRQHIHHMLIAQLERLNDKMS